MTWAEVDDGFLSHPKTVKAVQLGGSAAIHLWLALRLYSGKHLTDGLIDSFMVVELSLGLHSRTRKRALAALLESGLLDPCGDGNYQLHDYSDWAPSRATVEKRKAEAKARKEKYLEKHAGGTHSERDEEPVPDESSRDARAGALLSSPLPSPPKEERESPPARIHDGGNPRGFDPTDEEMAAARGRDHFGASFSSAIDPNFLPDASLRALSIRLDLNPDDELRTFKAHARAKKKRAVDWPAEFELWLVRSQAMKKSNGRAPRPEFEDRPEKPPHPDGLKWEGGEFDEHRRIWVELYDEKRGVWKWDDLVGKQGAWQSTKSPERRFEP